MTSPPVADAIDSALAAALRGEGSSCAWAETVGADTDLTLQRIHYHGIAGLLVGAEGWPAPLLAAMRDEAVARAMWELRHRQLLGTLLRAFEQAGVRSLLLKGTALAYGLYDEPALRSRGDTDLWVPETELPAARAILAEQGFVRLSGLLAGTALELEESWERPGPDGHDHVIDLHWSAVNSLALRSLFDFEQCWSRRQAITALGPGAFALDDADALLHAAVHRRLHVTSPYMVDGVTFYGGDRLIWAKDVDLLARRLGETGLGEAADRASRLGLVATLIEALSLAQGHLGTPLGTFIIDGLDAGRRSRHAVYLAGGQVRRAVLDIQAVRGGRAKAQAALARILPSRRFLQAKYGRDGKGGLARLLGRRLADFVKTRPASSGG